MARRDNQGTQIAMIVFILTTLVFMVTTYFGWSSASKLKAELADVQSRLDTANRGLRSSEQLVSGLTASIGLPSDVAEGEIQDTVNETVQSYGQGLPEENQNFRDILEATSAQVLDLKGKLARAAETEKRLLAEIEQIRETEGAIAAQAKEAEAQAVADLNIAQEQFQAYQSKLDAVRTKLAQDLDARSRAMNELRSATDAEVGQVQNELRQKELILEEKNEQINQMTVNRPDQFDGRVTGVVAATGTVWLDVGRADGLQPKTTFGVYDADDSNVRSAQSKADIEVTRILGQHRSEARVMDRDYRNPIVRGDNIFSPLWSPGKKLGIALVGTLDIDNDGTDDRKYIRNLIRLNGARIDAEDVEGEVKGEMTVNTRYLVVGTTPEGGDQNPALAAMLDSAARLGVEQTSLDELLDLMGYAGRPRSVSITGVVRPGDFAPRPRGGVTSNSSGNTAYGGEGAGRRTRPEPSR